MAKKKPLGGKYQYTYQGSDGKWHGSNVSQAAANGYANGTYDPATGKPIKGSSNSGSSDPFGGKYQYTYQGSDGKWHGSNVSQAAANGYANGTYDPATGKPIGGKTEEELLREQYQKQYEDALNQLFAQQQQQQIQANNQNMMQQLTGLDQYKSQFEKTYQDASRQGEVSNTLNKNKTAEQLKAMGYSGGIAESTLANMDADLYNTKAEANKIRQEALAALEKQKNDITASYGNANAQANNSYYENLVNLTGQKYQSSMQNFELAQQQKKEEEAKKAQNEVDEWNNKVMANIAKRKREGYQITEWKDSNGKIHYRKSGNKKIVAGKSTTSRNTIKKNPINNEPKDKGPKKKDDKYEHGAINIARVNNFLMEHNMDMILNPQKVSEKAVELHQKGKLSTGDLIYISSEINKR